MPAHLSPVEGPIEPDRHGTDLLVYRRAQLGDLHDGAGHRRQRLQLDEDESGDMLQQCRARAANDLGDAPSERVVVDRVGEPVRSRGRLEVQLQLELE